MNTLLTNDDGYKASGICTLTRRLGKDHKLMIVAPKVEHSGMSHFVTSRRLLEIRREKLEGIQSPVYSAQGTPADCVRVVLIHILEDKIDLVIPGCNPGCNIGMDIPCSGAASACAETNLYQLPATAVSAQTYKKFDADFDQAADTAPDIFGRVKKDLVEKAITLNTDVPYATGQPKKAVVYRIGEPMYDKYDKIDLDESSFELKLVGRSRGQYQEGTGRYYLAQGHTTMIPIKYESDNHKYPGKWYGLW